MSLRFLFSGCCSLMIGGAILLSACRGASNQTQQKTAKDSVAAKKVDTISPRIDLLSKRIASNPKDADSYWKRGILQAALGKYNPAILDYQLAIKIDSTEPEYHYSLADADFSVGHTRDAKDEFEKCINLDPKSTAAMMRLGELYFYVKKYPEAIDFIDQALKVNPYQAKAYFMKGLIFLEKHDTAKAISSMQTAVEQDTKYFDAYIQLGLVFTSKGNPVALTYFDDAINTKPGNVEAYYDKGMFYQTVQDYDKAIKAYEQLLQVDSSYKFAFYNIGVIYFIHYKDYKQSIHYFSRAIHADSAYSLALYGRGNCYQQLGQKDKALGDFSAALHYNPGFIAASDAMKDLQGKSHK